MDWDDLYGDSWELYKKIGNTILSVVVLLLRHLAKSGD